MGRVAGVGWTVWGNVRGFARQTDEAEASQAEGLAWKRPHGAERLAGEGEFGGPWACGPGCWEECERGRGCQAGCEGGCGERPHVFCASSRTVNSIFKPGGFQIWVCGDLVLRWGASNPPG